jgi:hypothetical protein
MARLSTTWAAIKSALRADIPRQPLIGSLGVRRLSIVVGFAGAVVLPALAIPSIARRNDDAGLLVTLAAFGFLLGWGLVLLVWGGIRGCIRVVGWVADGFRQDRASGGRD